MKTVKLTVTKFKGSKFEETYIFTATTKKEVTAQHQDKLGWMFKSKTIEYKWEVLE